MPFSDTVSALQRLILAVCLCASGLTRAETVPSPPEAAKATENVKAPPAAVPAAPSAASAPAPSSPFPLVDMFSIEQNPGQGFLEYVQGTSTERIELGNTTGRYGLGMVFRSSALPEQLGGEFKDREVVQIVLGTMRSKLGTQVSQFGSATLLTKHIPTRRTSYPLAMPDGQKRGGQDLAMLLFTSPSTPAEQSDEEKLKNTYFAQSGTVTFTPKSRLRKVEVRAQGQKLAFNLVLMEAEFHAKLSTPFNAQENILRGTIQFPIYWPEGKAGDALAKRLAAESFAATSTIQVPEEMKGEDREVAGQARSRKRKSRSD